MRFVIVSSLDALARLAAVKYLARRWPSASSSDGTSPPTAP
ncbi:hypothetical protein RF638_08060 [Kocuria sp. CPCC 205235]